MQVIQLCLPIFQALLYTDYVCQAPFSIRNPKNSQLLYRPNRAGETPYNMDAGNQRPILSLIFGARRLNTNEDSENILGYNLYSSALADILTEPSLSMPITVGLYAKWGSGKSFLLGEQWV